MPGAALALALAALTVVPFPLPAQGQCEGIAPLEGGCVLTVVWQEGMEVVVSTEGFLGTLHVVLTNRANPASGQYHLACRSFLLPTEAEPVQPDLSRCQDWIVPPGGPSPLVPGAGLRMACSTAPSRLPLTLGLLDLGPAGTWGCGTG